MTFYESNGSDDRVRLETAPVPPPAWRELGVLVLDGSESMTWPLASRDESIAAALPPQTKGAAVDIAVRELLAQLQSGRKPANFAFASVTFNDIVSSRHDPVDLLDMDLSTSYDPTKPGTGGTRIANGLIAARDIVSSYSALPENEDLPVSAVVVLMSDGEAQDKEETLAAAAALRELPNTQVACCLFATHGEAPVGGTLLQAIASSSELYQTVWNAKQLRDFFHKSMTMAALPVTAGNTVTR